MKSLILYWIGNIRSAKLLVYSWLAVITIVILGVTIYEFPIQRFFHFTQLELDFLSWLYLALAFALLPFNIGLEAKKWQLSIKSYTKSVFFHSVRIILEGRSLNLISPFGIGDAFSKIRHLNKQQRSVGVVSIFLVRFTQMIPAVFFGFFSVLYLIYLGLISRQNDVVLVLTVFFVVLIGFFILFRSKILLKVKLSFNIISASDDQYLHKLLAFSFLRYFVFTCQFVLVFLALDIGLSIDKLLLGIFWIFLFKSIVPNLTLLGDLGKREVSAMTFFVFFTDSLGLITIGTFVIWIINILVPALSGLYFINKSQSIW